MLDQIVTANPGRIAPVEWHISASYPLLYNAEGRAKWRLYPPPYNGGYATPWLWVDGKNRGYVYSSWESYVYDQLLVPSDVSLTHVGTTYSPASRSGQVQVECYNAGTVPIISAALQVVITEDSLYYTGPNGDPLHNHVCRDYVPSQSGTTLTLGPGATQTVTVSYSLDTSWVESNVKLVVYLQNMTVQPDSSMPCYQGLAANVLDFIPGVEESKLLAARDLRVSVSPNPCRTGCEFTVSGAAARGAQIALYAPDGRRVSSLQTTASRASWSRAGVARGIYLYRVNAGTATAEGKLVVTD
ncbi:Omp28-related outer membrane protein [candidate division WOR-3 bacterium]|uniref:Omp28-related outer membrane protein n=1 Tax=candidate division WOR-3 bacterium TaxID=2052148 RepID=A0A937XEN4_UNCW3|nr:Omp28-related outer membrane protein [candidate division WOR-3 bacterium]